MVIEYYRLSEKQVTERKSRRKASFIQGNKSPSAGFIFLFLTFFKFWFIIVSVNAEDSGQKVSPAEVNKKYFLPAAFTLL